MQLKNYLIFFLFFCYSPHINAEFQIKLPCSSDRELESNSGKKHKFYASMLAFNSEPPRCLKSNPIIDNTHSMEAELFNDEITNDMIVNIHLTNNGKNIFSEFTSNNVVCQYLY